MTEKPSEIDLNELGNVVKFHRKKSGMTQLALANLAGVGKTVIFDIENARKQPRLDTVARILKVLNIRIRFEGQGPRAH